MFTRTHLVFWLLLVPASLAAQDTIKVHPGDNVRLRLTGTPAPLYGEFIAAHDQSLVLKACSSCDSQVVARSSVQRVELQTRPAPSATDLLGGAIRGLVVGSIGGIGIAILATRRCHDGPCALGLLPAPIGAVVGVFAGMGLVHGEEWKPAAVP